MISVLPPEETEKPEFSAPNIFTPNGDGIHDIWQIPVLEHFPENRVRLYNLRGQLVFEAENYSGCQFMGSNGKRKGLIGNSVFGVFLIIKAFHKTSKSYPGKAIELTLTLQPHQ